MRAARQFGLGFGFTLILGSPAAFTVFLAQPAAPRPRIEPQANIETYTPPVQPHVEIQAQSTASGTSVQERDELPAGETEEPKYGPLESALARLDRSQSIYGFWSDAAEHEALCLGQGSSNPLELDDTSLTALGLWCMTQDGRSHIGAEQCNACRIALTYLLARGNGAGWYSKANGANTINTQALVILALSRLAANTGDRSLVPMVEAALSVAAFGNTGCGWGRHLTEAKPDAITTGWMLEALYAAQEVNYDIGSMDWIEPCLDELEKQARAENGESVYARAVFVAFVAIGSERSQGKAYEIAQEALLLRANKPELCDIHETYWIARALLASRSDGIWREAIRAKAETATLQSDTAESEAWHGGEVYRLALGIRILQLLR